jgi:hypothetical protein
MTLALAVIVACSTESESESAEPVDSQVCTSEVSSEEFRAQYVDTWCSHWAACPGTTWAREDCVESYGALMQVHQDSWDECYFDACLSDLPTALGERACDESALNDPDACRAALGA